MENPSSSRAMNAKKKTMKNENVLNGLVYQRQEDSNKNQEERRQEA
jgi:hypothetical protein